MANRIKDTNFNPGDRVCLANHPELTGLHGTVESVVVMDRIVRVKWDNGTTSAAACGDLELLVVKPMGRAGIETGPEGLATTQRKSDPPEIWADFGLLHQFAFPYQGGLYLSFQVWSADRPVVAELGFTREVVGGGMFRPSTPDEIQMGKAAGWEVPPRWTWLIPQLEYRIFIGADLIKELLLMWTMGWEPSEEVKQALAQASQEGIEDSKREGVVKKIIQGENGAGKGWPGGGIVN